MQFSRFGLLSFVASSALRVPLYTAIDTQTTSLPLLAPRFSVMSYSSLNEIKNEIASGILLSEYCRHLIKLNLFFLTAGHGNLF